MSDPDARYQAVEVLRTKAASAYFVTKAREFGRMHALAQARRGAVPI